MANTQQLIQKFDHLLAVGEFTQSEAAKAMGLSNGTVSTWRRGKYAGDNDRIEKLVSNFLSKFNEIKRELKNYKKDFDFVETSVYRQIETGFTITDLRGEIRVAVGASGIGKTTAIKHLQENDKTIILVEAYRGMQRNRLLVKIANGAGWRLDGRFDDMFTRLIARLEGTNRPIIIDEAEHLSIQGLDALRRINDFTGCPILLCGMPVLLKNLQEFQQDYGYIYNRTSIPIVLKPLTPEDTDKMIATMLVNDLPSEVWHGACHGIGRDLKMIVLESMRVADMNNITMDDKERFTQVIQAVTKKLGRTYLKI